MSMRGADQQQGHVFSYLSPEQRVRKDHPLRSIRAMVDQVVKELSEFSKMYSKVGRPHYSSLLIFRRPLQITRRTNTARNAPTDCATEQVATHSSCASSRTRSDSSTQLVLSLASVSLSSANIAVFQPLRFAGRFRASFHVTSGREAVESTVGPGRPTNRSTTHHPPIAEVY
jgi:hypothetical protein